jgi:hypothetical protein
VHSASFPKKYHGDEDNDNNAADTEIRINEAKDSPKRQINGKCNNIDSADKNKLKKNH